MGLAFFIVLNIADFISSSIMNQSSIFYGGNVRANSYVMYGMCFYQVSGESEAEALSKSIKNQGGAGFINRQGDYFIYASMYSSYSDATSVKEKLGGGANIINISVPAVNFRFNGNADNIVSAIGGFKTIYLSLYQTSIEYDKGDIDIVSAKESVRECMTLVQSESDKISGIKHDKVKLVVEYLDKTIKHLQTLLLNQYWGLEFNAAIKYAYFEAIFNNVALAKAI